MEHTTTDLIPYRKGDKWGFSTPDKKIVIECIYDEVIAFSEDFARVKLNGKWGFINKSGDHIIPCKWENAYDFSEGLAAVKSNDKYGFINKNGNEEIPISYDRDPYYRGDYSFKEGYARIPINGKLGYIDKQNKLKIPFCYLDGTHFVDGFAIVLLFPEISCWQNNLIPSERSDIFRKKGKWILIDKNNTQYHIDEKETEITFSINNELIVVKYSLCLHDNSVTIFTSNDYNLAHDLLIKKAINRLQNILQINFNNQKRINTHASGESELGVDAARKRHNKQWKRISFCVHYSFRNALD